MTELEKRLKDNEENLKAVVESIFMKPTDAEASVLQKQQLEERK